MRGGDLRRERYRCVTGKKGKSVATEECVTASYCGKLAFRLLNLVCRHNFNLFGHNFINPYGGGGHTISWVFMQVRSTDLLYHMYVIPYFTVLVIYCQQFSLLRLCFPSILLFGVGAGRMQNSVRLKEVQMFTYASVDVNWDAVTSNLVFLRLSKGKCFRLLFCSKDICLQELCKIAKECLKPELQ